MSARALELLRRDAAAHAWAIQDLIRWPERSRFYHAEDSGPLGLSYLLVSGHPASREAATVILGGEPEAVSRLLDEHLPAPPAVIRETDVRFADIVRRRLPGARTWLEQRMDVGRSDFRPVEAATCRRITDADAPALAAFHGAPPQAAEGMKGWIRGAFLMGAFRGADLAAIASTMVEIPEARVLVSIRTRDDLRGQGWGTRVTSALTEVALRDSPVASLTVRIDNAPAIRVYAKLGYTARGQRIWVDHGANSEP